MQAYYDPKKVTLTMNNDEALVLGEMLQRILENSEADLIKFLESSAEFAVLVRINNNLEKVLPQHFAENYDAQVAHARVAIIKESGRFEGIAES